MVRAEGRFGRGGPRLVDAVRTAGRIAWVAARRPFLASVVVEMVGALALGVLLFAGRELVERLTTDAQDPGGILTPTLLLAAALTVSGLAAVLTRRYRFVATEHINRHVARDIIAVATSVEYHQFENQRFNDLLDRARNEAPEHTMQLMYDLLGLINVAAASVVVVVVLATSIPQVLPIVVVIAGPALLAARASARVAFQAQMELTPDDRLLYYLYRAQTGRDHGRELRVFGLARPLQERWARIYERKIRRMTDVMDQQVRYTGLATAFNAAAVTGVLLVVANAALREVISLGDAAVAIVALQQLSQRLSSAANAAGSLRQATLFLDDFERFKAHRRDEVPAELADTALTPAALHVEQVSFTYPGTDQEVLTDISLTIEPGEIVALVGLSGSGKTTLSHLVAGLYQPTAGRIRYGDTDISDIDRTLWWRTLSVVFQDFVRYELTARENVGISDHPRLEELDAVRAAASLAGIDDALSRLPSDYETMLSRAYEGGGDLSVGQWQRVALARAFFRDAPLLLLDEPAAALDAIEEQRLFERLVALAEGRSVLLISHRFSTVRMADRICVMDGGRITELGTHDQLLALDGRYAQLFRLQARGYLPERPDAANLEGAPELHGLPIDAAAPSRRPEE